MAIIKLLFLLLRRRPAGVVYHGERSGGGVGVCGLGRDGGGGINDAELRTAELPSRRRRLAAVGGVRKVIAAINPNFSLCHDALQQSR